MKTKAERKIVRSDVDRLINLRFEFNMMKKEIAEVKERLYRDMKAHKTKILYAEYGNRGLELSTIRRRDILPKKFKKLVTEKEFYNTIKVPVEEAERMLGERVINSISEITKVKTLKAVNF